jgi:hypothetical protein
MRRWLVVAVAIAVAGACGVGAGDVQTIEADGVPFDLLAPPEPSVPVTTSADTNVVYLVRAERIVPVARPGLRLEPEALTTEVVGGPTSEETAAGLRTAITDPAMIEEVTRDGETVSVQFADSFAEMPPNDRLLAVAQLTFTLTELSGVEAVEFLRGTEPLGVPRPDGTVSEGPVRRRDFVSLTA